MVQFHEHIVTDLLDDPTGGLVILSSGLSIPKLLSSLLLLHDPSQGTLLLLQPPNLSSLKSHLHHLLPDLNIPEISADLPHHHRLSLYSSANVCFVTSRILIVDLLTQRIPTSKIGGLVILHAHSLTETATEAFIARILKSFNRNVCIRAFSDKPHAMVSGFAKTERIMKSLYIKRLHLWPRFQVYVSQDLERDPPVVVDVRVPMTKYMVGIQKAIIEVMDACLKEMRKTNKVDVEDLTVENGLFKSFDEIVRRQLDPIWHTLGKKTKQLVSDLKTLRKLLDYLVRYDAVSYLKYLDTLRVSESFRSVWIFAESSYKIFDYAKKRVYHFVRADGTQLNALKSKSVTGRKRKYKEDGNDKDGATGSSSATESNGIFLEEVLEHTPKWKVLREILKEIEDGRQKQALLGEEVLAIGDNDDGGIVLVACKDERSCMQLEECIMNSPEKVMRAEWEKYLLSKVELRGKVEQHSLQRPQKKKPNPKGFGILDGVVPISPAQNTEASSINKQEQEVLLAAATEIRKQGKKDYVVEDSSQPKVGTRTLGRGRGRRSKKGASNAGGPGSEDNIDNKAAELATSAIEEQTDAIDPAVVTNHNEGSLKAAPLEKGVLRKHTLESDSSRIRNAKGLPPIHFYALEKDQPILDILKPSAIIVYHPDMTFVREIEIYKAENPSKRLKVYFLFYEASSEVQKFEASIRKENGAFESLIRQKSSMMIPVDQDGHCLGLNSSLEQQTSSSQNSITRKAGGRKEAEKEMQVIVDMREFMSSLPNVLHQKGMRIIPVTLEVGDYILSPFICVERKSIQDLFMSFTSGRLYHQVETMVRYYRIPVLLIEFSQDKSFSFLSAGDIGDDVTPNSIISKLSLLVIHFPRLRIIWSRSLHATAEIFASLKANQDEPDESKAIRVGVPSEEGIVENDVRAENYNTSAVEFLRRLPGVTDSNYRAIMDGCKSLAELALLPLDKLAELMGGQKSARTLRDFLDAKYPTLL
ncbi:DNA repair endonuclease UVH1 isoform X2 [Tripterygium wilfordii]|uniref:DNA repair endonuclease UVH1 isoform X2 n=1 Tax=Tripterygium wilfordii TaxID=458696 RepID=A0A7J7C6C9_TRIWF|nr:DNA repair endonuclease UVH1 [Tripterygium wilfordii]KAF5729652.1 DNA repair endonuclease UVH1 isoform X2 [Tripterygium wilfordii]